METKVANKVTLYNLTMKFTEVYQPRYYVQYHGDVHDLSMDIYEDFLTPKSRVKGQEKTLLDRYDTNLKPADMTEEAFFANLCKVSVTRKLMDRSRVDRYQFSSLDAMIDEFGDLCCPVEDEDYMEGVAKVKDRLRDFADAFRGLKPGERRRLRAAYNGIEVKDSLYQEFFDMLLNHTQTVPVEARDGFGRDITLYIQSVTDKTITWYDPVNRRFCVSDKFCNFRTEGYRGYFVSRAVSESIDKEPAVYFKRDEVSFLKF